MGAGGSHQWAAASQGVMTTSAKTLEPVVSRAVREFARRIAGHYPVQQVILFGSRARGTQQPDSDADVAVLLRGIRGHFVETKLEMVDIAYDVLLDTGIYIQPLPIWENEWKHPETHSNPRLLQNIEREGIPLGLPRSCSTEPSALLPQPSCCSAQEI